MCVSGRARPGLGRCRTRARCCRRGPGDRLRRARLAQRAQERAVAGAVLVGDVGRAAVVRGRATQNVRRRAARVAGGVVAEAGGRVRRRRPEGEPRHRADEHGRPRSGRGDVVLHGHRRAPPRGAPSPGGARTPCHEVRCADLAPDVDGRAVGRDVGPADIARVVRPDALAVELHPDPSAGVRAVRRRGLDERRQEQRGGELVAGDRAGEKLLRGHRVRPQLGWCQPCRG